LTLLAAISCSTLPSVEPRAASHPGEPDLDGNTSLISDRDFRSILSVAREWLARTHPWLRVRRVHVVSRDAVEVFVHDVPKAIEYSDLRSFDLERSKLGWHVTTHNLDRAPTID